MSCRHDRTINFQLVFLLIRYGYRTEEKRCFRLDHQYKVHLPTQMPLCMTLKLHLKFNLNESFQITFCSSFFSLKHNEHDHSTIDRLSINIERSFSGLVHEIVIKWLLCFCCFCNPGLSSVSRIDCFVSQNQWVSLDILMSDSKIYQALVCCRMWQASIEQIN